MELETLSKYWNHIDENSSRKYYFESAECLVLIIKVTCTSYFEFSVWQSIKYQKFLCICELFNEVFVYKYLLLVKYLCYQPKDESCFEYTAIEYGKGPQNFVIRIHNDPIWQSFLVRIHSDPIWQGFQYHEYRMNKSKSGKSSRR